MVAFDGGIYRIGGFAARNKKGDDQDLWSSTEAARFDIAKSQWETLSPLAASRSSHDAAVWNGRIYVAGGWTLTGGKESEFHQSALVLDLDSQALDWNPLPSPPFRRRALAVGVLDDKLYVIGGMQEAGEPTNQVAVFDPETDQWTEGPPLAGSPMAGFGPAATTVNGKLYVSTYDGTLQRLSPEATAWQTIHTFEQPRFFHRMLPVGEDALVLIGGANMETGKFKSLEVVPIES